MRHIATLCYLMLLSATAQAGDVPLAWDQSTSPNIVFNRVYIGSVSHAYGTPITIPVDTTYIVTGLSNGTYFFAVTAVDADGNESDFSNEVSITIGAGTITPRPMQNLTVTGVDP